MQQIDQASYAAIQPELLSGETVLWAGQPSTKVIFHPSDTFTIPFTLIWTGFFIFWEASVLGFTGLSGRATHEVWNFGALWGIPFLLVGQYMVWGRFFYAAWLKKRTHYAVTNQRVVAIQRAWRPKTSSSFIENLPALNKEIRADGIGTLYFGIRPNTKRGGPSVDGVSLGDTTIFIDIEDADSVYRLVSDQKEKSRAGNSN